MQGINCAHTPDDWEKSDVPHDATFRTPGPGASGHNPEDFLEHPWLGASVSGLMTYGIIGMEFGVGVFMWPYIRQMVEFRLPESPAGSWYRCSKPGLKAAKAQLRRDP